LLASCNPTSDSESSAAAGGADAAINGIRFLAAGDARGFARALEPRELEFPRDHASHPAYRTEWWYFTGNLFAQSALLGEAARHFGFELTFFRIALSPEAPSSRSAWATNQVWMAHFAVTDSAAQRFVANERLARGALGLAGAAGTPLRVWLEDWSVEWTSSDDESNAMRLEASADDIELELQLDARKPPVLHGERGLDAKGPEPGNASHYYSLPRIDALGTIAIDGNVVDVAGSAWMDREWGTSALSPGLAGWDWFALQLSDGRDLMFYRLRTQDGDASPFSGGSLIDALGNRRALRVEDVDLEILGYWESETTGVRYPTSWRLEIPSEAIELRIEPYLEGQELDLSVRYWEGAVRARGMAGTAALSANGYLELAGY
jgi:predicted secreted hydrolase